MACGISIGSFWESLADGWMEYGSRFTFFLDPILIVGELLGAAGHAERIEHRGNVDRLLEECAGDGG